MISFCCFRTIHIIEATGSKGSPLNEIIVELRPHNGKNPNVNIIIVLKASDSNVVWVIRSRKIMGSLEIYVSSISCFILVIIGIIMRSKLGIENFMEINLVKNMHLKLLSELKCILNDFYYGNAFQIIFAVEMHFQ